MPVWFWSCRFTVTVLCCLSVMNMFAQQSAISNPSTCFANSSLTQLQNHSDTTMCDVSGNDESVARPETVAWREGLLRQLVLGPYYWGYLVSILPAGRLLGWSGGRKMLGYTHLVMSLATLLTPTAVQYMHSYTVTGLKFIAGLMAGTTYPSLLAIWQNWAPPAERTRLLAVTFSGIPLGLLLSTSVRHVICFHDSFGGTSSLLYALGLLGVVWFVLWMTLVSSTPDRNLRITEAERLMITKCLDTADKQTDCSLAVVVRSGAFWVTIFGQLSTEWCLYLVISASPIYLHDIAKLSLQSYLNSFYSTAPLCSFLVALLLAAAVTDACVHSKPRRSIAVRRLMSFVASLLISATLVILCLADCHRGDVLLVCITFATGCHGLQYLSVMAMPLEMSRENAARVGAIMFAVANVAKFAGSFVVYRVALSELIKDWFVLWYSSAALCLTAGISFGMFAGRSASPRRAAATPAAVTQSLELVAQSERQAAELSDPKFLDEEVDSRRPCLPASNQVISPAPHYVPMSAVDNHISHRPMSDQSSVSADTRSTHSQMISIV